jgi:hypothetical protein
MSSVSKCRSPSTTRAPTAVGLPGRPAKPGFPFGVIAPFPPPYARASPATPWDCRSATMDGGGEVAGYKPPRNAGRFREFPTSVYREVALVRQNARQARLGCGTMCGIEFLSSR